MLSNLPQTMGGEAAGVPTVRYCISPASFWHPKHIVPSAWYQHAPFAFWLIEALRPGTFVELGTHHGFSYLVFCQAVQRLESMTKCYAVDTWQGDAHAGFYGDEVFARLNEIHEQEYSGFSRLVRSSFDEALPHFGNGEIDLLHIDGRHGYEDVAHDFESWLPRLSRHAIVLLHDTNVRERGFGVWRFWGELVHRFPCFEFLHGHGLGVVQVGRSVRGPLRPLFESSLPSKSAIAEIYAQLGRLAIIPHELEQANSELLKREQELDRIRVEIAGLRDTAAQVEREARERRAADMAMLTDLGDRIEILKSELTVAREVGRAVFEALAASNLHTGNHEPALGWRQALRRILRL